MLAQLDGSKDAFRDSLKNWFWPVTAVACFTASRHFPTRARIRCRIARYPCDMAATYSVRVSFAVTSAEKRAITRSARAAGLSRSAYVRMKALDDLGEEALRELATVLATSAVQSRVALDRALVTMAERDASLVERELRARNEVRASMTSQEIEALREWVAAALRAAE